MQCDQTKKLVFVNINKKKKTKQLIKQSESLKRVQLIADTNDLDSI